MINAADSPLKMSGLTDTGFLFAVLDAKDARHKKCFEALENETAPFLPDVVLTELAYLVLRDLGHDVLTVFLRSLSDGELPIICADIVDLKRAAEILEQYADSKIDFVDAVIMAIAERLNVRRILTVDRRDFGMFRPKHCEFFEIVP